MIEPTDFNLHINILSHLNTNVGNTFIQPCSNITTSPCLYHFWHLKHVNTSTDFFKIKGIGTRQMECRWRDAAKQNEFWLNCEICSHACFERKQHLLSIREGIRPCTSLTTCICEFLDTEEGSCPSIVSLAERASFSTSIRVAVSFASQPYNFGVLLARSDSRLISDLWHGQEWRFIYVYHQRRLKF